MKCDKWNTKYEIKNMTHDKWNTKYENPQDIWSASGAATDHKPFSFHCRCRSSFKVDHKHNTVWSCHRKLICLSHLYVKPSPGLTKAKGLVGSRSEDKKSVRRQSARLPFAPLSSHLKWQKNIFLLFTRERLTGLPALLTRMRSVLGRPSPDLMTQLFFTIRGEFDVEDEERFKTCSAWGFEAYCCMWQNIFCCRLHFQISRSVDKSFSHTCPGLLPRITFLACSILLWKTSFAFSRMFAHTW